MRPAVILPVALALAAPGWLLKAEVLTVAAFALVYGFTAFRPGLPAWSRCPEVRGVIMVALGCICLFVPAQFILSALLIGGGARLAMTPRARMPGNIVVHPSHTVEKR